jgi:hypothetical protein
LDSSTLTVPHSHCVVEIGVGSFVHAHSECGHRVAISLLQKVDIVGVKSHFFGLQDRHIVGELSGVGRVTSTNENIHIKLGVDDHDA